MRVPLIHLVSFIGLAAAALACSSSQTSPAQEELHGSYRATTSGPISTMSFPDATQYSIVKSSCSSSNSSCVETGTYAFNGSYSILTLTESVSGTQTSLPFHATTTRPVNGGDSLTSHPLGLSLTGDAAAASSGGGDSLVSSSGGGPLLVSLPIEVIDAFTAGGQSFDGASDAGGDTSSPSPLGIFGDGAALHGVKIQCVADPANPAICATPFVYDTNGLTYAEAVNQLAATGVRDVVLKVCELSDQCTITTQADRNAEIVRFLSTFHAASDPTSSAFVAGYSPRIFLWERWWLWRGTTQTTGDVDFADDISTVIEAAKNSMVDSVLAGVGVIETQVPSVAYVLSEAEVVADRINADTNDWLTTHAFMFPGGANGAWFNDIGQQPLSSTFFQDMSQKAAGFTFIYKNMPIEQNCTGSASDNLLCSVGLAGTGPNVSSAYSHDFVDCLTNGLQLTTSAGYLGDFDCTTDSGKKSYLLSPHTAGGLGLASLQNIIRNDCGAHPSMTNVLFWGDSGDAFAQMSAGNVRVLHQAMVDDTWAGGTVCPNAGYVVPQTMKANQFSHLAIMPSSPTSKDRMTHVFTVSDTILGDNVAAATPAAGSFTDALSVFQQWDLWSSPTPTACTAMGPCY